MKINIIACLAALAIFCSMTACSSKGEQAEVKEETEQIIEAAHNEGREAAREFVNRPWSDTLELQHRLIEASSKRAKYDSLPQSREAFDSAFVSTVRAVRPDVARELDKVRNARH